MNDTQATPRQIKILNYLMMHASASRSDLEVALEGEKGSRITVIRDLNTLIDQGWLVQVGGGRHVVYHLIPGRELLLPIDLDEYFLSSPDERQSRYPKYNPQVIDRLTDLFTAEELSLFESGKTKLQRKLKSLDPTILRRELERFTIEFSWKSSQIEGNTYSLLETEELIRNQREASGRTRYEASMILNHKQAFDTLLENRDSFTQISLSDIRSIHSTLVKDLNISEGIRHSAVGITGTTYLPLDTKWQIEEALESLIDHTKHLKSVSEIALVYLAMLAYIQPFADGNKRTSRMVSNAVLLANGYYPLSYRSIDEVEYKQALILFYEQNNLYHLKRLFLEQQKFAIENYFL